MLSPADLDAYLDRIGYGGPVAPTRAALAELQLRHVLSIPFETLDSLSGRTPALDLPALLTKLVRSRRGGYCFEHNALFKAALEAFGFRPQPLLGRVLLGLPEDAQTPRTHLLLRIRCEGEDLVADTGFGGQVLTGPIRLEAGPVQETPHEPYRLDAREGAYMLRALVAGTWRALYRFTLDPAFPIDCEVGNHYVATHPHSGFTTTLVAALILPRGRLTLQNHRLTEHSLDAPSRSTEIGSDDELRDVLADRFGIEPDDATWSDAMRRMMR
ncbi:arylamine N-acetyltransferase family protein [Enterovirga rhinocerotis]|uniref:N-hydroxyarylamine O-acetyltransferase n=1 Tax=Enterovirga rhinocerotis TaxID=1339210 RepID=A0A4R7C643_9HYPH|nr:arylamine N-acetyltransferase [Enterovirga rhinocerotis]TDR94040.1 N-hydroxyarylamine O-acetyltransferase [Enterovirga rhinocerotis]